MSYRFDGEAYRRPTTRERVAEAFRWAARTAARLAERIEHDGWSAR